MIHRLIGLVALGVVMAQAFGGEANHVRTYEDDVKQLIDLEHDWVTAENTHDATTLRRILDDRFVTTKPSGKTVGREEFIKGVTNGKPNPTLTQTLTDRVFLIEGNTAVVVETDTVRWTDEGKESSVALRITVTYARRNGRWVALAEHMGHLPPAP